MKIVLWDSIKNKNCFMGLLELCREYEDDFMVAIWYPFLYCIGQGKVNNRKEVLLCVGSARSTARRKLIEAPPMGLHCRLPRTKTWGHACTLRRSVNAGMMVETGISPLTIALSAGGSSKMNKYCVPMVAYFTVTVYADDEGEAASKAERELSTELENASLNYRDDMRYQYCECPEAEEVEAEVDRDEEEDDWW